MKEELSEVFDFCNDPDDLLKCLNVICGALSNSHFCVKEFCEDCPVLKYYLECKKKFDMKLDPKTGLYL